MGVARVELAEVERMCLAVPAMIVDRDEAGEMPMATVDWNGNRRRVSLAFTPQARVGQWVLVHVGVAIQVLDEAEAVASLAAWQEANPTDGGRW